MQDLLTFAEFREANLKRRNAVWGNLGDVPPSEIGNDLAGEVGEVCSKVKEIRHGDPVPIAELGKELGDVISYADLLAARFGIDLGQAVRSKFNEVSDRVGSDIKLKPSPLSYLQAAIAGVAERDHHLKLMRLMLDRTRKAFKQIKGFLDPKYRETHEELDAAVKDIDEGDGLPNCETCRRKGEVCGAHLRKPKDEVKRDHLIEGQFQSDKYPWSKRGFVPLKITDPNARKVLREYAELRRSTDAAFSDDLLEAMRIEEAKSHG